MPSHTHRRADEAAAHRHDPAGAAQGQALVAQLTQQPDVLLRSLARTGSPHAFVADTACALAWVASQPLAAAQPLAAPDPRPALLHAAARAALARSTAVPDEALPVLVGLGQVEQATALACQRPDGAARAASLARLIEAWPGHRAATGWLRQLEQRQRTLPAKADPKDLTAFLEQLEQAEARRQQVVCCLAMGQWQAAERAARQTSFDDCRWALLAQVAEHALHHGNPAAAHRCLADLGPGLARARLLTSLACSPGATRTEALNWVDEAHGLIHEAEAANRTRFSGDPSTAGVELGLAPLAAMDDLARQLHAAGRYALMQHLQHGGQAPALAAMARIGLARSLASQGQTSPAAVALAQAEPLALAADEPAIRRALLTGLALGWVALADEAQVWRIAGPDGPLRLRGRGSQASLASVGDAAATAGQRGLAERMLATLDQQEPMHGLALAVLAAQVRAGDGNAPSAVVLSALAAWQRRPAPKPLQAVASALARADPAVADALLGTLTQPRLRAQLRLAWADMLLHRAAAQAERGLQQTTRQPAGQSAGQSARQIASQQLAQALAERADAQAHPEHDTARVALAGLAAAAGRADAAIALAQACSPEGWIPTDTPRWQALLHVACCLPPDVDAPTLSRAEALLDKLREGAAHSARRHRLLMAAGRGDLLGAARALSAMAPDEQREVHDDMILALVPHLGAEAAMARWRLRPADSRYVPEGQVLAQVAAGLAANGQVSAALACIAPVLDGLDGLPHQPRIDRAGLGWLGTIACHAHQAGHAAEATRLLRWFDPDRVPFSAAVAELLAGLGRLDTLARRMDAETDGATLVHCCCAAAELLDRAGQTAAADALWARAEEPAQQAAVDPDASRLPRHPDWDLNLGFGQIVDDFNPPSARPDPRAPLYRVAAGRAARGEWPVALRLLRAASTAELVAQQARWHLAWVEAQPAAQRQWAADTAWRQMQAVLAVLAWGSPAWAALSAMAAGA